MIFNSFYRNKVILRQFHTSSPRHVHPLIWMFLKPVLKGLSWVTGRSTRKWFRELPPEKRSILYQHLHRHKYKYIGIFGTLGTAFGVHYYTHLETSSITGRRRYVLINKEQLRVINDLAPELYSDHSLPENSEQTQLVAKVARKILSANLDIPDVKNIKWSVRVLDIDKMNATVTPFGDINVSRGMFNRTANEDQIAIVLGHELSHALLAHAVEKISYKQLVDALAILGAFIIWSILPSDLTSFLVNFIFDRFIKLTTRLPYSRFLEEEADKVGLMLAAKACYDIREAVSFWETVHKTEKEKGEVRLDFFSTHPASAKRAETLRKELPWALDIRRQCNCAPLPENETLDTFNSSKNPEQKIMKPREKQTSDIDYIPVVKTNKKQ